MSDEQKTAPTLNLQKKLEIPAAQDMSANMLESLKAKADTLGVTYSNNIGIDALREKINNKMNGEDVPVIKDEPENGDVLDQETCPLNMVTDEAILRRRMFEENMFLVRVRIANLNPLKKDIPGEWVTVHNKYLGTVRKYIPFGEATDNGYHVPKILLDVLKARKFNSIKTKKGKDGSSLPSSMWVKEFSIEELPYLTKQEMDQLARQQAAARGM